MLFFSSQGGASFSFEIDPAKPGFANINFETDDKRAILFHASVRPAFNVVVLNANLGSGWGKETMAPYEFGQQPARITITFEEDTSISLMVGEQPLYKTAPGDFSGIEAIASVRYDGTVVPGSIRLGGGAMAARVGLAELVFEPPFLVRGWAFDPAMPTQSQALTIIGQDKTPENDIPVDITPAPEQAAKLSAPGPDIGLRVNLPGRIWQGLGPNENAAVQAMSNGVPCGEPLQIARGMVVAGLERLAAAHAKKPVDHIALLHALEHIRFGKLLPLLHPDARTFYQHWASSQLGLAKFLTALDGDTEPPSVATPMSSPAAAFSPLSASQLLVARARERVVAYLRANPQTEVTPLLREALEDGLFSTETRRRFFLEMTEFLIERDKFPELYAVAAQYGQHLIPVGDDVWHNTAVLPYLYMAGSIDQVWDVLRGLSKTQGWVVTRSVAWTVRQVIGNTGRRGVCTERQRDRIITAYMALVEGQAQDYWGRSVSEDFTELAVYMLVSRDAFSDALGRQVESFVLRCHGLSHRFWWHVKAASPELSARLSTARVLFQSIERRANGDVVDIEPALRFFEEAGNHDAARYRIELQGPAGLKLRAPDRVGAHDVIPHAQDSLPLVMVRLMASPAAPAAVEEGFVPEVRQSVRALFDETSQAPYYTLQRKAGRLMQDVCAGLEGGEAPDAARLKQVVPMLHQLAGAHSHHLGLAMMMVVFDRLLQASHTALASHMLAELNSALQNQPSPYRLWGVCPGVRQALLALRRNQRVNPHALRLAVLHSFGADDLSVGHEITGGNTVLPISAAHSLYDTLVVVFSCKPYLESRIEAMRKTWLGELARLGVPYIVVVGDGDGRLEGDVVHLDAPDNYEGLPQKTLKAIEWVATQTQFSYLYKVDDDCFVDVEEFFTSLSYRKSDYYGRVIRRYPGSFDRTWHHEKSASHRGRYELDKSPENSVYADGGSGYVLSRHAMRAVLNASASAAGKNLIKLSFMEDKLVGDLLAQEGIVPSDEDYFVSVLRRSHSKAIPVSMWANGFYPSKASGVKLIHLDTHLTQGFAQQQTHQASLMPRKIWPSFSAPRLGGDSNALELVSDADKLARLNAAPLAVVACMRNERFMLPHFLAHYRKLGVQCFLIADNVSDDGSLEYLAEQPDVVLFSVDTQYSQSRYGVAWQQALLAGLRQGRWSLAADADELLVYKGWQSTPLPEKVAELDRQQADAVRIFMLDMYPKGPLSEADFSSGNLFAEAGYVEATPFLTSSTSSGLYANSPTWTSALRHRLLPSSEPNLFVAQKVALLKYQPWMRLSAGLHYVAEVQLAKEEMLFAHFKYHAEFRRKAVEEVQRGQHFNGAAEYRKYLALVSEGREVIYDPEVSVPWESCEFVRQRLL